MIITALSYPAHALCRPFLPVQLLQTRFPLLCSSDPFHQFSRRGFPIFLNLCFFVPCCDFFIVKKTDRPPPGRIGSVIGVENIIRSLQRRQEPNYSTALGDYTHCTRSVDAFRSTTFPMIKTCSFMARRTIQDFLGALFTNKRQTMPMPALLNVRIISCFRYFCRPSFRYVNTGGYVPSCFFSNTMLQLSGITRTMLSVIPPPVIWGQSKDRQIFDNTVNGL